MKKSRRLNYNSRSFAIVKYLFIGGAVVIALTNPYTGNRLLRDLVRVYTRKKRFQRAHFKQDLKRLQERKIITYQELENGALEIQLAGRGKRLKLQFNYDMLSLNTNVRWDRKWRMVMFDIPHRKKQAREVFRGKLRTLGFYPIQKSVFIVPYVCDKEIEFVASVLNIRQYILFFTLSRFEGEEQLKRHFSL
jgi:DNA-binding transcriptional regulator PaaX